MGTFENMGTGHGIETHADQIQNKKRAIEQHKILQIMKESMEHIANRVQKMEESVVHIEHRVQKLEALKIEESARIEQQGKESQQWQKKGDMRFYMTTGIAILAILISFLSLLVAIFK